MNLRMKQKHTGIENRLVVAKELEGKEGWTESLRFAGVSSYG